MENKDKFHTFRGYQIINKSIKELTSSLEDYLEMIYREYKEEGYARINQLAKKLNVQASSATKNVQKLAELGFVIYKKYGIVQLTQKGKKLGLFLLDRHNTMEKFLSNIGVKENLLRDTEMIEHNISNETLQNIIYFNNFLEKNSEIINKFNNYKTKNDK